MTRRVFAALAALALAGGAVWAGWRGLETCGWLDRALGRSGCEGSVRFDGVLPSRGNLNVPFDSGGRAILAAEMRTVDGWRNGLIRLDPVTGEEAGRFPVPLRHPNMRLLAAPEGPELLLLCGVIERGCTDSGGDAVLLDRETLTGFRDHPVGDRYLRAFPGQELPGEEFGPAAVFAMGGDRIVSDRRAEGVQLLDTAGRLVATLSERVGYSAVVVVSPDGGRILRWEPEAAPGGGDLLRVWEARDGREIWAVEGTPGWRLRAPPFWSADGSRIFAPRHAGGGMRLDRFPVP